MAPSARKKRLRREKGRAIFRGQKTGRGNKQTKQTNKQKQPKKKQQQQKEIYIYIYVCIFTYSQEGVADGRLFFQCCAKMILKNKYNYDIFRTSQKGVADARFQFCVRLTNIKKVLKLTILN